MPLFFLIRPLGVFGSGGRYRRPPRYQLQPLVAPQVLHFMQVPLRTNV